MKISSVKETHIPQLCLNPYSCFHLKTLGHSLWCRNVLPCIALISSLVWCCQYQQRIRHSLPPANHQFEFTRFCQPGHAVRWTIYDHIHLTLLPYMPMPGLRKVIAAPEDQHDHPCKLLMKTSWGVKCIWLVLQLFNYRATYQSSGHCSLCSRQIKASIQAIAVRTDASKNWEWKWVPKPQVYHNDFFDIGKIIDKCIGMYELLKFHSTSHMMIVWHFFWSLNSMIWKGNKLKQCWIEQRAAHAGIFWVS